MLEKCKSAWCAADDTPLSEMGFRREHIAATVTRAMADHSNATTPCRPTAEDFETLLRAAL